MTVWMRWRALGSLPLVTSAVYLAARVLRCCHQVASGSFRYALPGDAFIVCLVFLYPSALP
eukprot:8299402-Pyramimonas_sp.AAC.1